MSSASRFSLNSIVIVMIALSLGACSKLPTAKRTSPVPHEFSLEDQVRERLDFSKFDRTQIDENTAVLVSSKLGRRFFNREAIEKFHDAAKANGDTYSITSFKILEKDETPTSRYATIKYETAWQISIKGKTSTLNTISYEIWERQIDGWHRIFSAIDSE